MKRLLVVDNNPLMLDFMSEVLTKEGYEVHTASSGLDALHTVKQHIPDAMFIDLVMPQIDGKQLCKLFRADPELEGSYLFITSGIAAEGGLYSEVPCADAYIAKSPFKQMKKHILTVLEDFTHGKDEKYENKVLGKDELYKREITNELLYSKHHLEVLISQLDDGLVEVTPEGEIIYANPAACKLTETSEEQLITRNFSSLFGEENTERIHHALEEVDTEAIIIGEENPFSLAGKEILLRFLPITYDQYRSVSIILQDITERKRNEKLVKNSLEQKETLLKEVHHRVKNNLTVIASLLNLQSSHIQDEEVRKHLIDSRNRVESMALVHERLYFSEDQAGIDLPSYFEGIISKLIEVYCSPAPSVTYEIDMPSLIGTMELAVPLGLILNEVVSNSLEHAFGNGEETQNGLIRLGFGETDDTYRISISDNGKGLPEDFNPNEEYSQTLGLLLASTLAEQIHGEFSLDENGEGVVATIQFPTYRWQDKLRVKSDDE